MSKLNHEINITPQFEKSCEVFNLQAHELIQAFVDKVSIYDHFISPFGPDKEANLFVIAYAFEKNKKLALIRRYQYYFNLLAHVVIGSKIRWEDVELRVHEILNRWIKENSNDKARRDK